MIGEASSIDNNRYLHLIIDIIFIYFSLVSLY